MNWELINQTPLPARLLPHRDQAGRMLAVVIAKATWRIDSGRLAPAEQQLAIFLKQQSLCLGDLDLSQTQRHALGKRENEEIVWLDHDLVPPKAACRAQNYHRNFFQSSGRRILKIYDRFASFSS